ncbi:MAG: glutamyl-tRNA reductase [Eubacteriales bacterium]|nr:glutamyl-tRNA reductase [Eubacteriales bacterium]
MSVQMVGIDHTKASIEVRTVFSFTKKNIAKTMETWKNIPGLHGVVILSTCNRMEVWASVEDGEQISLYELLCREKEVATETYREFAVCREGREAVEHLFALACGLESRILGEDQIITQVKDALAMARENYSTDHVLEVLFRMAVTAGKRVKTEVILSGANASVIHHAVLNLKQEGYRFDGKKCMVIGNGEMGKLSANVLVAEGADVTVTVRQYRSGVVEIPKGCQRIDYSERMELLPKCDYVISATASPNFTIMEEQLLKLDLMKNVVLLDLAVPRDIDPMVKRLPQVRLYDIDYFHAERQSEQTQKNIAQAHMILEEYIEEFYDWYEGRDVVEMIQRIKELAVEDFHLRIQKQEKALNRVQEKEDQQKAARELAKAADTAAGKIVNKLIFGLKGKVSDRTFRECVEAIEKVFQ